MTLQLWTVSYEGRSAAEIVRVLRKNGIERVVHIRSVARDLDGSALEGNLAGELEKAGIEFEHVESVGGLPSSWASPPTGGGRS